MQTTTWGCIPHGGDAKSLAGKGGQNSRQGRGKIVSGCRFTGKYVLHGVQGGGGPTLSLLTLSLLDI